MSDFDAFDTPAPEQQATEEDPAADFLAREQDQLKGLEDDNFGAESGTQGTGTTREILKFHTGSLPPVCHVDS